MRVDGSGEFWIPLLIGATLEFLGGTLDQALKNEWSVNAIANIAISTIEGAITAITGPLAGALISGIASGVMSASIGKSEREIFIDAAFAFSLSVLSTGIQLGVARITAGKYISNSSGRQLKSFANSLGYTGRNFKKSSLWTSRMMMDASIAFKSAPIAKTSGYASAFLGARAWSALSY